MPSKPRSAISIFVAMSIMASSSAPAFAQSGVAPGVAAGCANVLGASAAAAAQATRPGCVLPAIDAAPVAVQTVPGPVIAPIDEGGKGLFSLPLLLGLVAAAGLIYLALDSGNDDDDDGISPC